MLNVPTKPNTGNLGITGKLRNTQQRFVLWFLPKHAFLSIRVKQSTVKNWKTLLYQ